MFSYAPPLPHPYHQQPDYPRISPKLFSGTNIHNGISKHCYGANLGEMLVFHLLVFKLQAITLTLLGYWKDCMRGYMG